VLLAETVHLLVDVEPVGLVDLMDSVMLAVSEAAAVLVTQVDSKTSVVSKMVTGLIVAVMELFHQAAVLLPVFVAEVAVTDHAEHQV
jgi:hypothetical protein